MQNYLFLLSLVFILFACHNSEKTPPTSQKSLPLINGDIIFQTSTSSQSEAIQLATNSRYSHVGIVFQKGEDWFVFEAIQPVSITPIEEWIARGKDKTYTVKRLKDKDFLDSKVANQMIAFGQSQLGKPYDLDFQWSDEKMYCSELVWKLYHEVAGVKLCALKTYSDYELGNEIVAAKIIERFGKEFPVNEQVISPEDIFNSELLETVQ